MQRIRSGMSYANVTATLALFLVLAGGGAYAGTHLSKNSVTSKAIKDGQVKTADLANRGVTSGKIASGVLPKTIVARARGTMDVTAAPLLGTNYPFSSGATWTQAADETENAIAGKATYVLGTGGTCALLGEDPAINLHIDNPSTNIVIPGGGSTTSHSFVLAIDPIFFEPGVPTQHTMTATVNDNCDMHGHVTSLAVDVDGLR